MVQPLAVAQAHVLHMTQPVVGQAHADAAHRRAHAGATVVAHHDDVLDLQMLHRELDGRQRVQVAVHHHIGHVAVNENLARVQPGDFIGRHAAVGAAYPHVARALLLGQAREKAGLAGFSGRRPTRVVVQQFVQFFAHCVHHLQGPCLCPQFTQACGWPRSSAGRTTEGPRRRWHRLGWPRTWGTPPVQAGRRQRLRFIPTHMGNAAWGPRQPI